MREVKGLAKDHTTKLVGAYLNKNLRLLMRNPKDIPPHYVRHTSGGKEIFKIYLNNHLNDTDKKIYTFILIAFA